MMSIKTPEEIKILREGGKRLAAVLRQVIAAVRPGVSTLELDRLAESLIFSSGGTPAFKGYRIDGAPPFPGTLCTSVNDEVVHGIPRADRMLKDGDMIGLDIGMWWPTDKSKISLVTDMAVTVGVGNVSKEAERLMKATKDALDIGIAAARPGARIGDISSAIQKHLEKNNFGIVRGLAGHGVGYQLHEDPIIPNYGVAGKGHELKEGMVIAIEPMATAGDHRVALCSDRWTFRTRDNSLAAHFEHSIAIGKKRSEILTQ